MPIKLIFLVTLIALVSACSIKEVPVKQEDTQALKNQIQTLTIENANLREENNLLRAGGIPETSSISDGSLFPEGSTFEESSLTSCMKNAYSVFLSAGIKKCSESGYSEEQFNAGECQLTQEDIDAVSIIKSNEESICTSLYQ